jgi:hypothetical protein
VKVIRKDKAEITVAPTELRMVATLSQLAPGLSEVMARKSVKPGFLDTMVANQSDKR